MAEGGGAPGSGAAPAPVEDSSAACAGPTGPRDLFLTCQRLALQGFGGVLPVAQHDLVERRRWLSREGFVDLLALAQVLPGPNIVNLVMIYGDRCFGWRGALAAGAGILVAPLGIVLLATLALAHAAQWPVVAGALRGMGAVAAGLVVATALRLAGGLARNPLGRWRCAALGFAAFIAVGVMRWPLVAVLGVLGTGGCLWAWRHLAPAPAVRGD